MIEPLKPTASFITNESEWIFIENKSKKKDWLLFDYDLSYIFTGLLNIELFTFDLAYFSAKQT